MGEQVNLEEYHDDVFTESMYATVEYPCVFIEGVNTEEEIAYFRSHEYLEDASVPLYTLVEGIPLEIGRIDLTLQSLLTLRSIYAYGLTLFRSRDDSVTIDLNDANVLSKFIRL